MKPPHYRCSRAISVVVTITGSLVMLGWTLDIGVLKSILPIWVTMKFSGLSGFPNAILGSFGVFRG